MKALRNHEAAELFPMLTDKELEQLADDIREHGLRVPIVLQGGKVIDGRNRILACKRAGVAPKFVELAAGVDPFQAVWSFNAERRQITDPVRLAGIVMRMAKASGAWTQARDAAAARRRGGKSLPSAEGKVDRKNAGTAAAAIGRTAGVSRASVERFAELERKRPDLAAKVVAGELPGARAIAEVKRSDKIAKIADIAQGNRPLKAGPERYGVIYADPPWRYDAGTTSPNRAIESHYPTMSLEEICALDVHKIAASSAVLFLWTTAPMLGDAFSVLRSWGFSYRTHIVWHKTPGRMGMGHWARIEHELLLIAVRGNVPPPAPEHRPPSVIAAPPGKHSEKPDVFRVLIERMYALPRMELFSRKRHQGWAAWGNQAA